MPVLLNCVITSIISVIIGSNTLCLEMDVGTQSFLDPAVLWAKRGGVPGSPSGSQRVLA